MGRSGFKISNFEEEGSVFFWKTLKNTQYRVLCGEAIWTFLGKEKVGREVYK
jgi:hypothetical protein